MTDVTVKHASLIRSGTIWQNVPLTAVLLWLGLFAATLICSVVFCEGRLVFSLDDPYIHLAVADQIRSGGYGVNASEFSSPSSSIIWPYILVVTETLHLGAFGPLLIDAAAAAATIVTFLRVLETAGLFDGPHSKALSLLVVALAILASNAVALPMTGMENSLHVWATVATFAGLTEVARGRSPSSVHFAALVLLPLIRFEGAAFALAAILGFALLGQRRFAAAAAAIIACVLVAYVVRMASLGLPLLPSSVLLKSRIAETAYEGSGAFASILRNFSASFDDPAGFGLMLLGLALAGMMVLLRSDRTVLTVCATVLAAIGAHLTFGQYGWFFRYEIYIVALVSLALLYAVAHVGLFLGTSRRSAVTLLCLATLFSLVGVPNYTAAMLMTPYASRSIYEQQYQMGRFAQQFYRQPVAVNDLGLVAYGNSNFVLDLWGLGSEQVRKAKLAGHYGPTEMAALAEAYHVGVVMIYARWFSQGVPASWAKVAILHTIPAMNADADVTFYLTPQAEPEKVKEALKAFGATLPQRAHLVMVKS